MWKSCWLGEDADTVSTVILRCVGSPYWTAAVYLLVSTRGLLKGRRRQLRRLVTQLNPFKRTRKHCSQQNKEYFGLSLHLMLKPLIAQRINASFRHTLETLSNIKSIGTQEMGLERCASQNILKQHVQVWYGNLKPLNGIGTNPNWS